MNSETIERHGWTGRYEIGADLCAVLRAMRGRYRWANRVGTFEDLAYTWDKETDCEMRTWLAGISAAA